MPLPLLQLALDYETLANALNATRALAKHVDVLKAGTILVCAKSPSTSAQAFKARIAELWG